MMVAAKRSIAEATRPGRFASAQEDGTPRDSAWVTRDGRQHINNKQERELRDLKDLEERSTSLRSVEFAAAMARPRRPQGGRARQEAGPGRPGGPGAGGRPRAGPRRATHPTQRRATRVDQGRPGQTRVNRRFPIWAQNIFAGGARPGAFKRPCRFAQTWLIKRGANF